jgi:hypothetical protein
MKWMLTQTPMKLINIRSIQNIFHFGFEVFTLVLVKIQGGYIVTDTSEMLAPPPSSQCVSEIILGFYFWKSAKY